MITITLDTPLYRNGLAVTELVMETPIRAGHLLRAMKAAAHPNEIAEIFTESIFGLNRGELELLTLEDYCKVQETIQPFMASFNRLHGGKV